MARVDLRFYIDPATGEPHIYEHGVSEEEVEEVLSSSREERPALASARASGLRHGHARGARVAPAPAGTPHALRAVR